MCSSDLLSPLPSPPPFTTPLPTIRMLVSFTSQPYRRESPSPYRGLGCKQVRTTQYVHSLTILTIVSPHSRLAFPVLVPSPHQLFILESQFRDPGYNIPNIPVFPFPYSLLAPPLPLARPPWSSYLSLALSAVTPALSGPVAPPFSRIRLSHSLSSRLPSWSSPSLLPWPDSPPLSTLPVPISPRCLALAFVGHTFFGVCIALRPRPGPRVTNQYAPKCMVILRTYALPLTAAALDCGKGGG